MREPTFPSRLERFARVDSTQRIVRDWLSAGEPGPAVAVADEQVEGRGRQGRGWSAPSGAGLLASVGFGADWLTPIPLDRAWQLPATLALAMLEAAEGVAGLPGRLWLKWPNDLVVLAHDGGLRKLAGVLTETASTDDRPTGAVVGIGVNVDWDPADFPAELAPTMTSLRALVGRAVDRDVLLSAWLEASGPRLEALRAGRFEGAAWEARQVTTGRRVEVELGGERVEGMATGVEPGSGALLVGGRSVPSGEVVRCRVVPEGTAA